MSIQSKTGLGKSTIGWIKNRDKKSNKGGHPSKLSWHDKQFIMCQITIERFNNAVQAMKFLDNITLNPIHPQPVRNCKKEQI